MENATIYFDAIDVIEVSSNFTNGRELSEAEAKDWMIKHCGRINELLADTFKNYIREHLNK